MTTRQIVAAVVIAFVEIPACASKGGYSTSSAGFDAAGGNGASAASGGTADASAGKAGAGASGGSGAGAAGGTVGSGGAGGSLATGGVGGSLASGGAGGTLATGGVGGTFTTGGVGGTSTTGGVGGTVASGGVGGTFATGGAGGTGGSGQCTNLIVDGGFEAGILGGTWTESSTTFGSPVCSVAMCGAGTGSGPHGGVYWVWLGGVDTDETAFVSQNIVIPRGTATLRFWLEIPTCSSFNYATLLINIDGGNNIIYSADSSDARCGLTGYVQHVHDVSAFADGGTHRLQIIGTFLGGTTADITSFMIDDVRLDHCPGVQ
jgi:hypothetical protein